MAAKFNKKFLSEDDIRYAMANTLNNHDASIFLNVSIDTYRKYATQYYDSKSKKNLYELHKTGLKRKSTRGWSKGQKVNNIISGIYKPKKLTDYKYRDLLIKEGKFLERCNICGFDERRTSDYRVPLVIHYIDGNKENKHLENIELLCLNCNFLIDNNIFGKNTI